MSAIFGEPVERNGVTVIPVGRTSWAFGGGEGRGDAAGGDGDGSGGGGGVLASPAGYIEISAEGAVYRRIEVRVSPAMVIAVGITAHLTLRALRALGVSRGRGARATRRGRPRTRRGRRRIGAPRLSDISSAGSE